ncbi:hypothetical protein FRC19_006822 [Serendipita sp. 401]|nr:hypothetical protein FRC19_006822 [Serendipita sp. 401]
MAPMAEIAWYFPTSRIQFRLLAKVYVLASPSEDKEEGDEQHHRRSLGGLFPVDLAGEPPTENFMQRIRESEKEKEKESGENSKRVYENNEEGDDNEEDENEDESESEGERVTTLLNSYFDSTFYFFF